MDDTKNIGWELPEVYRHGGMVQTKITKMAKLSYDVGLPSEENQLSNLETGDGKNRYIAMQQDFDEYLLQSFYAQPRVSGTSNFTSLTIQTT